MVESLKFADRVRSHFAQLSPAERVVARFIQQNREEVMVASAMELANIIGTSDATVVRTSKALGYSGLDDMRRALARELRTSLSPAARLARTLEQVGDDLDAALQFSVETHLKSLESLRRNLTPELYRSIIGRIVSARRVVAFGIGPSSAMAEYMTIQLNRFGIDALALTDTGLLLADGLHRLRAGDLLVILAYGRIYHEVEALLKRAAEIGIPVALITDSLGPLLEKQVDVVLTVARGQADMLSMHTGTLGLIEAVLVGLATKRRVETVAHLGALNSLRSVVVGKPMDLPALGTLSTGRGGRRRKKRR